MKMNFGKWIVVAFVLFATFIATLVTVCVRQDIPLVTKEYYQQELQYQEQIERAENALNLTDAPRISVADRKLKIDYSMFGAVEKGELSLFRPSDPGLDEKFEIKASGGGTQVFSIRDPQPGLYRARLTWSQEGKEYYMEKVIVL